MFRTYIPKLPIHSSSFQNRLILSLELHISWKSIVVDFLAFLFYVRVVIETQRAWTVPINHDEKKFPFYAKGKSQQETTLLDFTVQANSTYKNCKQIWLPNKFPYNRTHSLLTNLSVIGWSSNITVYRLVLILSTQFVYRLPVYW